MNGYQRPLNTAQDKKMETALSYSMQALIREEVVEEYKDPLIFGKVFMIEQPHDGKIRLIYDCRILNQAFKAMKLNLPTIFNAFTGHRYFTKIDIENCFYHFKLSKQLQKYFGFNYQNKNYIWKRMPFGWRLAPYV
jgi:lipopolysaccharide biosynthesis glycosyltransferase